MNKIIIADIASLAKGTSGFGHYAKVAKMYSDMFKNDTEVIIAGGPIYQKMFPDKKVFELPYNTDLNRQQGKWNLFISKLKMIVNCVRLFSSVRDEIVVCQPYSFFSWMIGIIICGKNKKIYLIEYKNELQIKLNKALYRLTKNKINGIICPNKSVGKQYEKPYITVPDYIYCEKMKMRTSKQQGKKVYDIGIVGIMSSGKDIEDVVRTFANTSITVLIKGYFQDKKRVTRLINEATENIEIIDKYLTDSEYEDFFNKVKYVALPYSDYYKNASSGVIFDIIFHKKPIITKKYNNFDFIEKYDMGILYAKSISEVDIKKISVDRYKVMVDNIDCYLSDNQKNKNKLFNFLVQYSGDN